VVGSVGGMEEGCSCLVCVFERMSKIGLYVSVNVSFICNPFLVISYIFIYNIFPMS
jgi:hypothetical protein